MNKKTYVSALVILSTSITHTFACGKDGKFLTLTSTFWVYTQSALSKTPLNSLSTHALEVGIVLFVPSLLILGVVALLVYKKSNLKVAHFMGISLISTGILMFILCAGLMIDSLIGIAQCGDVPVPQGIPQPN